MLYINRLVKKRQVDEAQSLWDEAEKALLYSMQTNNTATIPVRVKG